MKTSLRRALDFATTNWDFISLMKPRWRCAGLYLGPVYTKALLFTIICICMFVYVFMLKMHVEQVISKAKKKQYKGKLIMILMTFQLNSLCVRNISLRFAIFSSWWIVRGFLMQCLYCSLIVFRRFPSSSFWSDALPWSLMMMMMMVWIIKDDGDGEDNKWWWWWWG